MKTTASLLLLCLSACSTAPRPMAPVRPLPVLTDTAGTAYAEAETRRVAAWEWAAGGGR